MLLDCLDAQINSVTDSAEIAKLKELQTYYYDRGIPIPETRELGVIHRARLGSMESNVLTLNGNRMKGCRACWSEKGANNLAMLLCQRHTIGFEGRLRHFRRQRKTTPNSQILLYTVQAKSQREKEKATNGVIACVYLMPPIGFVAFGKG